MPDPQSVNPSEPAGAPAGSTDVSIERAIAEFYAFLATQKETAVEDDMDKMKEGNDRLRLINSAIADLSKLHVKVTDTGDAKKLAGEVNADPTLMYAVNQALSDANLSEPPFGPGYGFISQDAAGRPEFQSDAALALHYSANAIGQEKNYSVAWEIYRASIPSLPASPRELSKAEREEIARELFNPRGDPPQIGGFEASMNFPPTHLTIHQVRIPLGNYYQIRSTWSHLLSAGRTEIAAGVAARDAVRIDGGLNTSRNGADLNRAIKRLQADATSQANTLQSDTMKTSSSMNLKSAVYEGFKSYLDKMSQVFGQICNRF